MKTDSIILFDGVCNLCNAAVQFVIKHDKKNHFVFASLQSEEAKKLLSEYHFFSSEMNSFLLVEDGKIYHRSTAALRVLKNLNGWWRIGYVFIIVPKFLRDGVYNVIAKNRYRWFGKKNNCMIPTLELQSKFLN